MEKLDFLRRLPYFAGLPDQDLKRLCGDAPEQEVDEGETLLEQGAETDALYIVMAGQFEVIRRSGEHDVAIASVGPGSVLGEISLLEGAPHSATVRALRPSRVARIARQAFEELLESPGVAIAMLHTVVDRLRQTEAAIRPAEKMAALGTLTAGLLHELNNPAAAVHRGAIKLEEHLRALLGDDLPDREPGPRLRPLERSEREEQIAELLDELGVEGAWGLAPSLVVGGWTRDALADAVGEGPEAGDRARRLGHAHAVIDLVRSLRIGAERVSGIVASVKRYSHHGEAPIQNVDVHDTISDALMILGHKLNGIDVDEQLADEPILVEGNVPDLNQLWTNLIDNAIDAMDGQGRLEIRTEARGDRVVVEVIDSGPGVPEDVRDRLFEPFFTTKPPGAGTGLGLHTSQEIALRHGGRIEVDSVPGRTVFRVSLRTARAPATTD